MTINTELLVALKACVTATNFHERLVAVAAGEAAIAKAEQSAVSESDDLMIAYLKGKSDGVRTVAAVSEPVAWMHKDTMAMKKHSRDKVSVRIFTEWDDKKDYVPLYATPPAAPLSAFQVHKQAYQRMHDMQAEIDRLKAGTPAAPLPLSDDFVYKVVRSKQPHLRDDCSDWSVNFKECKYWLQAAHNIGAKEQ